MESIIGNETDNANKTKMEEMFQFLKDVSSGNEQRQLHLIDRLEGLVNNLDTLNIDSTSSPVRRKMLNDEIRYQENADWMYTAKKIPDDITGEIMIGALGVPDLAGLYKYSRYFGGVFAGDISKNVLNREISRYENLNGFIVMCDGSIWWGSLHWKGKESVTIRRVISCDLLPCLSETEHIVIEPEEIVSYNKKQRYSVVKYHAIRYVIDDLLITFSMV